MNYLDRFLQSQPLASECLQLTGITALWVAAKQVLYLDPCGWVDLCIEVTKLVFSTYALKEEAEPPEAKELVRLCDSSYCASDFKHMEVILLDR